MTVLLNIALQLRVVLLPFLFISCCHSVCSLCKLVLLQLIGIKKAGAMYTHYAIPNNRMLSYL